LLLVIDLGAFISFCKFSFIYIYILLHNNIYNSSLTKRQHASQHNRSLKCQRTQSPLLKQVLRTCRLNRQTHQRLTGKASYHCKFFPIQEYKNPSSVEKAFKYHGRVLDKKPITIHRRAIPRNLSRSSDKHMP
jgi:hypothetical protein